MSRHGLIFCVGVAFAACTEDADEGGTPEAGVPTVDAAGPADAAPDASRPAGDGAIPDSGGPADGGPADAAGADLGPTADAGAGCDAPRPLAQCERATAYADCGGAGPPAAFCDVTRAAEPTCLWFVGGCPAAEYPHRCGQIGLPDCPVVAQGESWGVQPWDRERALDVTVALDPAVAEALRLDCGPDGTCTNAPPQDRECLHWSRICHGVTEAYRETHRGALVVRLQHFTASLGGSALYLEVELALGRARACLVAVSDVGVVDEPHCATAGTLVLDQGLDATDAATLSGRFELDFGPGGRLEGGF